LNLTFQSKNVCQKESKTALSWKFNLILKTYYHVFSIKSYFHDYAIFFLFLVTNFILIGFINSILMQELVFEWIITVSIALSCILSDFKNMIEQLYQKLYDSLKSMNLAMIRKFLRNVFCRGLYSIGGKKCLSKLINAKCCCLQI